MPFQVYNSAPQGVAFTVAVVFTPLCTLATVGRFYSTRLIARKVSTEDWLALGALVFFWGYMASAFAALYYLNGREPLELPLDEIEKAQKAIFVGTFMFPWNQLCAKYSILFCYYRLFGLVSNYGKWIYAIGIGQLLYHIPTCIVMIFQCRPVEKYWSPLMDGWCVKIPPFQASVETVNSLIDFAMVLLAVIMLRHVPTDLGTKFKLGLLFAIGGLAGIIGFIKIGFSFSSSTNYNQIILGVWATVQIGFSVICCSALTYKPLFAHLTSTLYSLKTRYTSYGSQSRTEQPSSVKSNTMEEYNNRSFDPESVYTGKSEAQTVDGANERHGEHRQT